MNDSIYEEYMRSVLGYQPASYNNTNNINNINNIEEISNRQTQELENCYPDIYRIVYPMVQKACSQNTQTITRELVDNMTNEIYFSIEDKEMLENRDKKENENQETENRQIARNQGLNDLIRILILRELLGRPGFPGGGRPPRPPMRPPMRLPIGPPRPQPRPGMRVYNRDLFETYDDLYEY